MRVHPDCLLEYDSNFSTGQYQGFHELDLRVSTSTLLYEMPIGTEQLRSPSTR